MLDSHQRLRCKRRPKRLLTVTDGYDSDGFVYTLTGGSGTDWNPGTGGPFTIEVRMKSFANNSSTYNAWLRWFDGNSSILLQVWDDKVYLNGTEVDDMNNVDYHTYRIVSETYTSSASQRFDLYRDDSLIIDDAANYADYTSPQVKIGDQTGTGEINIEIDYIRWDDDSNTISGYNYSYDANELPNAASPAYTYSSNYINATEAESASVSGGILSIDTVTDGYDNDASIYTLTGGTGTAWDPITTAGPFTIETKMKSQANNSSTYNAWLRWFDGNSSILLQVWNNKLKLNSEEVTGLDNSSDYHTYRIISYQYGASVDQKFDLYRDGELVLQDVDNAVNFDSKKVMIGDQTGYSEVDIDIDYIRWSDELAIEP